MFSPSIFPDMSEPWYKHGIRFGCKGCGYCCRTENGEEACVYLSGDDISRMARILALTDAEFTDRWTEIRRGQVVIKDPDKDCPFLQDNGCAVYEARPAQCRTWPFWEIALVEKNWKARVLDTCPGARNPDGKLYTREEIDRISKDESPL
jgi:Fe-S-cluster containining protein